mmetsp:Transcript_48119/g.102376  ORF Transcript_48119/g.102376 Transcript_48119/m.102376 type:complete len:139 (+) Transcript_48119:151-567(+)
MVKPLYVEAHWLILEKPSQSPAALQQRVNVITVFLGRFYAHKPSSIKFLLMEKIMVDIANNCIITPGALHAQLLEWGMKACPPFLFTMDELAAVISNSQGNIGDQQPGPHVKIMGLSPDEPGYSHPCVGQMRGYPCQQ